MWFPFHKAQGWILLFKILTWNLSLSAGKSWWYQASESQSDWYADQVERQHSTPCWTKTHATLLFNPKCNAHPNICSPGSCPGKFIDSENRKRIFPLHVAGTGLRIKVAPSTWLIWLIVNRFSLAKSINTRKKNVEANTHPIKFGQWNVYYMGHTEGNLEWAS